MELREFVAETLTQIVEGVRSAQNRTAATGARVNPPVDSSHGRVGAFDRNTGTFVHEIEFDVAVSTVEGTGTKGGVGVFVGPVALGSQGQSEASQTQSNRIKFVVPLLLPVSE